MKSAIFLALLCLTCVSVYGQDENGTNITNNTGPSGGFPMNQSTEITPEVRDLINTGLQQLNNYGGVYTVANPVGVVLLKYTTQVVAGLLSTLLMEVDFSTGSKLVSVQLLDQSWRNVTQKLQQGCVFDSTTSNVYPSTCNTADDCQTLLNNNGKCVDNSEQV